MSAGLLLPQALPPQNTTNQLNESIRTGIALGNQAILLSESINKERRAAGQRVTDFFQQQRMNQFRRSQDRRADELLDLQVDRFRLAEEAQDFDVLDINRKFTETQRVNTSLIAGRTAAAGASAAAAEASRARTDLTRRQIAGLLPPEEIQDAARAKQDFDKQMRELNLFDLQQDLVHERLGRGEQPPEFLEDVLSTAARKAALLNAAVADPSGFSNIPGPGPGVDLSLPITPIGGAPPGFPDITGFDFRARQSLLFPTTPLTSAGSKNLVDLIEKAEEELTLGRAAGTLKPEREKDLEIFIQGAFDRLAGSAGVSTSGTELFLPDAPLPEVGEGDRKKAAEEAGIISRAAKQLGKEVTGLFRSGTEARLKNIDALADFQNKLVELLPTEVFPDLEDIVRSRGPGVIALDEFRLRREAATRQKAAEFERKQKERRDQLDATFINPTIKKDPLAFLRSASMTRLP